MKSCANLCESLIRKRVERGEGRGDAYIPQIDRFVEKRAIVLCFYPCLSALMTDEKLQLEWDMTSLFTFAA